MKFFRFPGDLKYLKKKNYLKIYFSPNKSEQTYNFKKKIIQTTRLIHTACEKFHYIWN